jgi:hypothetical protein
MRDLEIDVCAYNTRFHLAPFSNFLSAIKEIHSFLVHFSAFDIFCFVCCSIYQHSLHHGVVFFFVVVVHTTQSE